MLIALVYLFFLLLLGANVFVVVSGKLGITTSRNADFWKFQTTYLWVYCLIMFADWLQGPYLYRLYEHYGFLKVRFMVYIFATPGDLLSHVS